MVSKQLLSSRSPDSAPTLLKSMVEHRQHKASDARDKVYGLLGISQTEDDFFRSVVVDYEAPASELYGRVASSIIQRQANLDLLEHCRGQALKGLPSWVPDCHTFSKAIYSVLFLPRIKRTTPHKWKDQMPRV